MYLLQQATLIFLSVLHSDFDCDVWHGDALGCLTTL
jgi:hypothetical protein